ncbi:MAG: hypothetical protein H8D45_01990 [Bacteroidetes bacterium]|nr:hypothetical protein [Bacteroidota bacterium]
MSEIKVIDGQYNSKDYYYRDLHIGKAWWDNGGYRVNFSLTPIKDKKFESYDDCLEWLEAKIDWLIDYLQD